MHRVNDEYQQIQNMIIHLTEKMRMEKNGQLLQTYQDVLNRLSFCLIDLERIMNAPS